MITFAVELWSRCREEICALGPEHYAEVSQFKDLGIPYDLDFETLGQLEALGKLHCVVGRSSGQVVAYHISVLAPLLHYRRILSARGDVYYMRPGWRTGRNPLRMFEFVHQSLDRRGVAIVYDITKFAFDHRRLFEFMGYAPVETTFSKWLTKPQVGDL